MVSRAGAGVTGWAMAGQKGHRGALPAPELGTKPPQGLEQGQGCSSSLVSLCPHQSCGILEEEGLKIITPSCFPYKIGSCHRGEFL